MSLKGLLGPGQRYDWATPPDVFAALDAEFHFTVDVCATTATACCPRFYTPHENAFWQSWRGEVCWMNPPYGKEIRRWMARAYEASHDGATVVCLVPSRTDTAWWHDFAMQGEIRFIRGRLRFDGHRDAAPFPSAVVIFRPRTENDDAD